MNRSFIMLLVLVIFLGAGFGGSFVGGVIYGQTLQDEESELSPRLGAAGQFPVGGQNANAGQRGQGRQGQGGGGDQSRGAGFGGGQGQGDPAARQGDGPGNVPGGQGRQGQGEGFTDNRREGGPASEIQASAEAAQADSFGAPGSPASREAAGETGPSGPGSFQGAVNRGGAVGTIKTVEGDLLTLASPRGDLAVILTESTRLFQVSETNREALETESRVRIVGPRDPEGGIAAQSVIIVPEGVENLFGGAGGPGGRQRGGAS